MEPAVRLRAKLATGEITIGALLTSRVDLAMVELCMRTGLDYVILDLEHFAHRAETVADACAFGRVAMFPVLIRPPRSDADAARLAMDLGPCGLLLSMVESAAQLDDVGCGIYLPPRGDRRPGGPGNRWVTRFTYDGFKGAVEDHVIIIPQIENQAGLASASEIAAHPMTTALGVGPFDLSAHLGVCGELDHPMIRSARTAIRSAAAAAGKPAWMIGRPEALVADGYHFICTGDPMSLLETTLAQAVRNARGG